MSKNKKNKKKREQNKPRELVILGMILAGKGQGQSGRMRGKGERKPKGERQKREDFQQEDGM